MDVDYFNIDQRLIAAVQRNDVAGLAAILAADPPSASFARAKAEALHDACWDDWNLGCLRLLLAAGTDPNSPHPKYGSSGLPIHRAANMSSMACVAALLAAGADPLALDSSGELAIHKAGDAATVRLLLAAAPQAALVRSRSGKTAVETAIPLSQYGADHFSAAQCLLAEAPLAPVPELVSWLRSKIDWQEAHLDHPNEQQQRKNQERLRGLLQLVPILVARLDLAPSAFTQHARHHSLMVSSELARWLPAMMERSEAAAARLVAFLPARDRRWLRTLALSLGRYERSLSARLPPPILRRLLVLAAEGRAQHLEQRRHKRERRVETALQLLAVLLAISFWVGIGVLARKYRPSRP